MVQPSHKRQRKKNAKALEEEKAEESFQTFLLKHKLQREAANKKPEIDPVVKAQFIKQFIKDPTKEKERESDYDRQIRKCYSNPRIGGLMQRPFPSSESSPNNRSLR